MNRNVKKQRGVSYVFILLLVATTAIGAGVTAKVTATYNQREKENELIFRGLQIKQGR